MQNNAFNINKLHEEAALLILEKLRPIIDRQAKAIISVSGEVASGKSPVSLCLGRQLKKIGKKTKLIDLDDFYIIPPLERRKWRTKNGFEKVGLDEINWKQLESVIEDFHSSRPSRYPDIDLLTDKIDYIETDFSDIDLLIIHGLYSMNIHHSDLKVYMEMTWPETMDRQRESMKEVMDEFRIKTVEREHEVVMELKKNADVFIDLNTASEIFHL